MVDVSWADSGPPTAVTAGSEGSRPQGDSPVLPAGAVVGRYEVRSVLGLGGMGVVYEAWDAELGRATALKLLRLDVPPDAHADLKREAQALARLSHPNVVTIHDVGTHDGSLWVAMELVDGITGAEWIARPRTLAETLDVLRQAAAGLAAVHDCNLVHRDFKPGNIMITAAGRVLVMDFGLARLVRSPTDGTPTDGVSSHDSQDDASIAPFGTPAYMAPEQHRAELVLPLADQFSFCAAAYEALYGQRAFASESLAGIALEILRGNVRAPPADAVVPAWLARVVRRGLSLRPEDRYPSMHALLAALQPPRRRWPWLLAAGGVIAGSIATYALVVDRGRDCTSAGERIDEVWNDSARAEVSAAFATTELPFGDRALASATTQLDAYATAWADAAKQACETPDEHAIDATTRCLAQRREAMHGLVDALRSADAVVVQQASAAAAKLPAIELCADPDALRAAERRPDDPAAAEIVDALEARRLRARALLDAGKAADAAEAAETLVADARAIDHPLTMTRALVLLGTARGHAGDVGRARELLEEAYVTATGAKLEPQAADAASLLLFWAAQAGDIDGGLRWKKEAEALVGRLDGHLQSRELFLQGAVVFEQSRGERAAAIDYARENLDLALALHGDEHPRTVIAMTNLGSVLLVDQQLDAAEGPLGQAYEASVRVNGELHPDTGKIAANIASVAIYRGRNDEALRWLAIADAALTTMPAARAMILNNRSQLLDADGELEEAHAVLQTAVAALEQAHGDDHPATWTGRSNLADAMQRLGRTREALDLQLRVRDARRRLLGPEHVETIMAEVRVANSLDADGRHEEALEMARAAAATGERALGPDHLITARALVRVGACLVQLGRGKEAIAPLLRGIAIREKALGPDHSEVAEAQDLLARATAD
jgi:tetratricopeptide (TPR) repeat protein